MASGFITHSAAAITVDGTRDAEYGASVAVQTVQTGFGDATSANGLGGGGELDAAYARVENDRLFVMITGNIENNFNKLSVFIDSKPGGENTLSGTPQYDFENISQNFGGLTFDSGFEADYHLYARWGSLTGNVFTVDIVDRAGGGSTTVTGNGDTSSDGAGTAIQSGVVDPTDLGLGSTGVGEVRNLTPFLAEPLEFGFNNTNTAGVGGNQGAAANQTNALAVTTGFEFSIALDDLGGSNLNSVLNFHVVYGNSNNNFHSNQTLGGLPVGTNNLGNGGSPGNLAGVDFNDFAGDQFFSVSLPVIALPGDYDADGLVGQGDLDLVLLNWGQDAGVTGPPTGWVNQTPAGLIGQSELDGVLLNWGNAAEAVEVQAPEPVSAVLLGLGSLLALRRR